jgi:hypothetical protein
MSTRAVVHHLTGTVEIVGDQVVVRMSGTRGLPRRPRLREIRLPVRWATARASRNTWHPGAPDLDLQFDGRPVQTVLRCPPDEVRAFLEDLERARSQKYAECGRCGAPAQPVGAPCHYCGETVWPTARVSRRGSG